MNGVFWDVADFTTVMSVEPETVTLFFTSSDPLNQEVLRHLPAELEAGNVVLVPCVPNRVC